MADQFQTSFIPKKTPGTGSSSRSQMSMNLFAIVSIALFVVAALASVGVFAYKKISERELISKQADLERSREAFEPSLIEEIVRLDERITSAEKLVSDHVAMSGIFKLIEDTTLETVQFTHFQLSRDADGMFRLALTGSATGFAAVALQSDELGEHPLLDDVLVSNFSVTDTGRVTFTAGMSVDPSVFDYEPPTAAAPNVTEPTSQTDTTTSPAEGAAEDIATSSENSI